MWVRNLLAASVVLGAVVAFGMTVMPDRPSDPRGDALFYRPPSDDFNAVVDRLNAALHAEWTAADIEPAPRADDMQLARRVSLALAGTIPSLEEVRLLEAMPDDERLPWWTSHLLADRRYADYFAERMARSTVGVVDGPFIVFRRRRFVSWLSDQLHADRPYDALVREIVTSSGIWTDSPATNFVTVTLNPAGDQEEPNATALAGRVARAFLGVRLDCAECHDHPFQDWAQVDFQGLAAFFAGTKQSGAGIYEGDDEFEAEDWLTGEQKIIEPAVPFHDDLLPAEGPRRVQLAAWLTNPRNEVFARAGVNRVWTLLCGQPLVAPVDDIPIDGEFPPVLDILAQDFAANGYDLRRLIRLIVATDAFQRDSRAAAGEPPTDLHHQLWAAFPLTRLRPEQVVGSLLQATSLATIDHESHIILQIMRSMRQNDFVKRYGDGGEDELLPQNGAIPQRLLMMNGELVKETTKDNLFGAAATQIAVLAPTDDAAIETAYLAVLSRRPTPDESRHFSDRLTEPDANRRQALEDLYWTLLNSTEFSWNH